MLEHLKSQAIYKVSAIQTRLYEIPHQQLKCRLLLFQLGAIRAPLPFVADLFLCSYEAQPL